MLPNTLSRHTQKHSRSTRQQTLNNQETDREIREAINAGSATNFVTSRIVWRLENGLFGGAK